MTRELSKETIMFWRTMTGNVNFELGLMHLRREHAPRTTGSTVEDLLTGGAKWHAYNEALDDLTNVLTAIEKPQVSLEEPPLNA